MSDASAPGTPAPAPDPAHAGHAARVTYNYAVLRAVPHVYLGTFVNVGVVVHARQAEFVGMKALHEVEELRRRIPDADVQLLARYLASCEAVCRGEASAGPVAMAPASERFHWITAPRSDVLQASPVHEGVTRDPAASLEDLFRTYVLQG